MNEDFQPSFDAKAQPERVGTHYAGSAPRETLDSALAEKIRAITSRAAEAVE